MANLHFEEHGQELMSAAIAIGGIVVIWTAFVWILSHSGALSGDTRWIPRLVLSCLRPIIGILSLAAIFVLIVTFLNLIG